MAFGGDDGLDVVGRYFLEADQASIDRSLDKVRDLMVRHAKQAAEDASRAQRTVQAAEAKAQERDLIGHLSRLAGLRSKHVKDMTALEKAALAEVRNAIKADLAERERRDVERLKRLAERQKAAARQQLQDTKAANAREAEEQKRANRAELLAQDHHLKELRNVNRLAHEKELEDHKQTYRLEVEAIRQANRLKLQAQEAANRATLQAQREAGRQQTAVAKGTQDRLTIAAREGAQRRLEAQRSANRKAEETQKATNARFLTMQRSLARQQEIIAKGTQARLTAAQKAADQRRLTQLRSDLARQLEADRAANKVRLEREKADAKIRVLNAQAAQDRITQAEAAGQAERLARQVAHEQRSNNRHKTYWSIFRGTVETSQRFISSSTQAFFARRFARQQAHERSSLSSLRGSEAQRRGILRSSYAQQEATVSRSLVRQQGLYTTYSNTLNRGIFGTLTRLRNLALVGGGFLSARAIFGPVADYQQIRIAFSGLLRGMARTEPVLANLREFAEDTPFRFSQLAESARRLLGIGFDSRRIIPILSDIGGAAATLGASDEDIQGVVRALGQMIGQGKANAEDINQITERFVGFNVRAAIAAHLGISVGEAMDRMRAGLIPANVAVEGILAGMRNMSGAEDALERQSRTLNGRLSTLGDVLYDIQIRVFSPLIPKLAMVVGGFTAFLEALTEGEGAWAVARSGLLGIAFGLGAILSMRAAVGVLQVLRVTLLGLMTPWGFFTLAVTGIVAAVTILARHVPVVGRSLSDAAEVVTSSVGQILSALGDLATGDVSGFLDFAQGLGERLLEALRPAIDYVVENGRRLFDRVAPVVVDAWDRAFEAVATFIREGGLGRIRDAVTDALARAFDAVRGYLPQILTGLAAALLVLLGPFGIIGGAIIGGLAATGFAFREQLAEGLSRLPGLFFDALQGLGRFLGGPFLDTVLSPFTIKLALGLAAGALYAAGRFLYGFIDGLRTGIPAVVGNIRQVFNDLIGAAFDGLADLPVIGQVIEVLETPLLGIMPTLEAFVGLIARIPTPVLAAAAALFLFNKAWVALKATSLATQFLPAIVGFFRGLPMLVSGAAASMERFSTQMQIALAESAGAGGLNRSQRLFRGIAQGASTAAAGTARLAGALPAIGTAAAIGIPIIMGLWEQHRQKQEAARRAAQQLGQAFREQGAVASEVIRKQVEENQFLVESLNEAGVSIDSAIQSYMEGTDAINDLAEATRRASFAAGEGPMLADWRSDEVQEFADELARGALVALELADANGELTSSQRRYLDEIRSGERDQNDAITLMDDLADAQSAAAEATEDHSDKVRTYIRDAQDAARETDGFRAAISRLTGGALDVGRARLAIRDTMAEIRRQIQEGAPFAELEDDFISAAENIIDVRDALFDAGRPREAAAAYEFLRQALMDQYEQLGFNESQAREFVNSLVPPEHRVRRDMDRRVLGPLREAQGEMSQLISDGLARGIDDEHRQQIIDDFQTLADEFRESIAGTPAEITWRLHIQDVRWDEAVRAYGRAFERGEIDVGIRFRRPEGRIGGSGGGPPALAGATGIAGPVGAGTGGVQSGEWATAMDAIIRATDRMVTVVQAHLGAFSAWFKTWAKGTSQTIARVGDELDNFVDRVTNRFESGMARMVEVAKAGGANIVKSLVGSLREGGQQVSGIVSGYTARLARALNPILRAIGEEPINVRNFRRGEYLPRIAEGADGPQVHVFNEAGRHGEAYIPFDPSYRNRARDIAGRSVSRLGGRVQWFREGGITRQVTGGEALPNLSGDIVGLVYEFAKRISTWATARGENFNVTSGFRTYAEQVAAWRRYLAGTGARAAVPGSSMHEVGLAVDGPHWGPFNPATFGIHYPVRGEPWHAEPVEGRGLLNGDLQFFPGINPLPTPPDAGARGVLSRVGKAAMDHIYQAALDYAGGVTMSQPAFALGSAGASPEVLAGIRRAMTIVGVPPTWMGPLLTLISRESGFNPRAYNGILGASGLMQTIPSTFAAYHLPAYPNIFGIIDNVVAGLRYILARYGTIFNVGQATSPHPTSGYRRGGITTGTGMAMLHPNEVVLPLDNHARLTHLLRATGLWSVISAAATEGRSTGARDLNALLGGGDGGSSAVSPAQMAPLVGGDLVVQSNASDGKAVSVHVGAKLRGIAHRVRES